MAIGREDYQDRKSERIARYENEAAKANGEAVTLGNRAHTMGEVIPLGQPILVGHHSEGAHRSLVKKIEGTTRKAGEAQDKAAYYAGKAESAAKNRAISGDNPDAMGLYQKKLEKLETRQEQMKAVNKAFSKGDEALRVLGFTDEQIATMKSDMPSYEKNPYPSWALSNNSAEIRRIKKQVQALERLDEMTALEKITFPGGELVENPEINRVQFLFAGKPSDEVRATLKASGFRWAPSEQAWQRQRTAQAIWTARRIAEGWKI